MLDTLGGMATVALTEETFGPTVQGSPIVFIVFGKVDTEAQPGLAEQSASSSASASQTP